jgi:hypothetical protein
MPHLHICLYLVKSSADVSHLEELIPIVFLMPQVADICASKNLMEKNRSKETAIK